MREYRAVSFGLVEELAFQVRKLRFELVGTNPSLAVEAPLNWFMEAYATGKYESIFVVWDGGLDEMQGRTLYEACLNLC